MKAIIFDIGKVLVTHNFPSLYVNFAEKIGIPPDFVIQYHKENWIALTLGTITLQDFFEAFQKQIQGKDKTVELLKQVWLEEALKLCSVNGELLNWIDANRGKYTIGVLSNLTYSRMILDEAMDLYSHFDFTVLSCVEHIKKPDPAIYRLALKRAGVTASEAVFIDDKEECVAGAKEAGIKDLLYVNNELLFEELKQL